METSSFRNKRYESRLRFLVRTHGVTLCVAPCDRRRSQILRGELRTSCSLQVARGTSHFVLVASGAGNFALRARCKSRTARICSFKSRGEKRLQRFSLIRAEAFIPHPFGCNKRYKSRLQFLMRTHSTTFTARCVIGDAHKSCAGNFALRARCKWRGELRTSCSLQVARGTSHSVLVASGAGNFALRARCKWRGELRTSCSLQVARGTSHFVLVASGAGNFALRARCKVARGSF